MLSLCPIAGRWLTRSLLQAQAFSKLMRKMEQLPMGPAFFCRWVVPAALVAVFGLVVSGLYRRTVSTCAALGGGWLDGLQFDGEGGDDRAEEGKSLLRRARTLWEREQAASKPAVGGRGGGGGRPWGKRAKVESSSGSAFQAATAAVVDPEDPDSDGMSLLAASGDQST